MIASALNAEVEFARLRRAVAWSPLHTVVKRIKAKRATQYRFSDGSRLVIYASGAARWFGNGRSDYAAGYHHCNTVAN